MRILAVAPYYPPDGGGLERYAHAHLARLAQRGHDVQVHAFAGARTAPSARAADKPVPTDVDGVHVTRHAPSVRLGNTPVDLGFCATLRTAIASARPDVVVGHTPVPFAAEMAYRASRQADVPFVATYHAGRLQGSSGLLRLGAWLDRATLERRMLTGSRILVAVSPYVRDNALAKHRDHVAVVPPGVDLEAYVPAARSIPDSILVVAPLSHAYHWKGIDVVWEAYTQLRKTYPQASMTLVGDGDRAQEFAARAAAANKAGAHITLAGRLAEHDLVAAYGSHAVTVLPSTTDAEAFGMVLAEANACGRPVIGSRIGGIPDFVRDGHNGLLAKPGDAADLARCIARVWDDGFLARAMGSRGRTLVEREHDWDKLSRRMEAVYDVAAEKRSG